MKNVPVSKELLQLGRFIALFTAVLTLITFAIAVCTPPLSGPFCQAGCFQYPYADIAHRFPRDYIWMYPAIILSFSYLLMMAVIYHTIQPEKKLAGLLAFSFALFSACILSMNYFIQVSVVPPSVLAAETDGIALLSQFNPHGLFIVLEEAGFLFMICSFFCLFPVFNEKNVVQKAIKWISIVCFVGAIFIFVIISIQYGVHREYRFEVAVITVAWMELIVLAFLLANYFKKQLKNK